MDSRERQAHTETCLCRSNLDVLWYETTITWNDWISDQIFSKTCNTQDYNTPYRRSCANFLTFNFGEFMSSMEAVFLV